MRPAPPRYNPAGKLGASCPDEPQDHWERALMAEISLHCVVRAYISAHTIESNGGNQLQLADRLVVFHAWFIAPVVMETFARDYAKI